MIGLTAMLSFALANGEHQAEIAEGKSLVESKVSCDGLSDEQLEAIGEYFMEQMHPGEQHEIMHERMGVEEGTEEHEQFHVDIARMMYCGEGGNMAGFGGMMNNGMMGGSGGMMMGGMMRMMMGNNPNYYPSYNNYYGFGGMWTFGWLFMILIVVALVLFLVWLLKQIQEAKK